MGLDKLKGRWQAFTKNANEKGALAAMRDEAVDLKGKLDESEKAQQLISQAKEKAAGAKTALEGSDLGKKVLSGAAQAVDVAKQQHEKLTSAPAKDAETPADDADKSEDK